MATSPSLSLMLQPTVPQMPIKMAFMTSFRMLSAMSRNMETGDFNAVTGPDRSGFEQVVGPFGSGTPNDNSARLLTLCALLGLSVAGSWFHRTIVR